MPLDGFHVHDYKSRKVESLAIQRLYTRARRAEAQYAVQLRKIARTIGDIISGFPPGDPDSLPLLTEMLNKYSHLIRPWAQKTSIRMLADVGHRNDAVWFEMSKSMGRALREEIRSAPTGQAMRDLLQENVHLITTMPLNAAERVHKLTLEGIVNGTRASSIAQEIMYSGHVAKTDANRIARTEVARTASILTQVRSEHIGSTAYIWRTSKDEAVRKSHKEMEGQVVDWDHPPTLSDGTVTHAGQIYNCRCYPEPIVPDTF